ncbi:MAG: hypothetical protein ACYDDO_04295 [Acidiferrobacterales bacterium]
MKTPDNPGTLASRLSLAGLRDRLGRQGVRGYHITYFTNDSQSRL